MCYVILEMFIIFGLYIYIYLIFLSGSEGDDEFYDSNDLSEVHEGITEDDLELVCVPHFYNSNI